MKSQIDVPPFGGATNDSTSTSRSTSMASATIHEPIQQLAVPVQGLKFYGANARRGDVAAIKRSLQKNGQYKPIVVRTGTMEVLAGNHTLKAALELGWDEIAATFVTVTDDEAARIVLVDNRTNDLATYDDDALRELLVGLEDLDGTGYTAADLDALLDDEPVEVSDGADEIPESIAPLSKPGDLFELGPHRVICGDSTDPDVLARLMGGQKADLIWTDPPYGVDYVGKTKDSLTIRNDGAQDLDALLHAAFETARGFVRGGAPFYVAHADTARVSFETAIRAAGFLVRQNLIWVKNTMALGRSDYHYRHEPVLYGFTPGGDGRLGRGGAQWFGDDAQTTVFEVAKPAANREHPTMKPVELILAHLRNSVKRGGLVLDMFGGSGSTLMAAHDRGAVARIVELDPRYVDVICARYQRLTGEKPRRGGVAVDFLAEGVAADGG